MVNDAKRFLALNALMHGHAPEDAFQGDPAEILSLGDKETATLFDRLKALEVTAPSTDPLVMTMLNFFRNEDYAFLSLKGQYILRLGDFADDDFNGQISKGMSNGVLANLLRDYAPLDEEGKPYIADGVLCCSQKEFTGVNKAMQDAYKLMTKGPNGMTKKLNMLIRRHSSLDPYVPFSSVNLLEILDGLVDVKLHPAMCQKTFLRTSDLLDIYKATGCIMAYAPGDKTSVDWLMDVHGSDDLAASVRVSLATLRNHLLNSVQDLRGAHAVATRGKTTYDVRYAGD